jgi:hypothetical protein
MRKAATAQDAVCHHALAEALRAYIDAAVSLKTARDGCSAQHAGTTGVPYQTNP